jgi:signal transduction histidine kinase
MKSLKTLLVIEDNPGDARLLHEMFHEGRTASSELKHVSSMGEAEAYLANNAVQLILLDLGLPDVQGVAAIRRAHLAAPSIPLVVLTGLDDEDLSEQTLQEGAQDYLIKGQIDSRGLLRALRYAVERKRLERLKDEFVATVSHELRTPLTSISGSLGLLMGKAAGVLPDAAARLLAIAHANSQRLVRLVNDILDIEKLESGQVVFNFRSVNVRSLVEQTMEANRGFADAHGVRMRLEVSANDQDVSADADRLSKVITNLLSNAVKFAPVDSEVIITIENREDSVRTSVRDRGPGISADFRPRLFERFAQADATNTRPKSGTGLGLSIVKQIVERLGGEVGFIDAPGGGSIFYVELPNYEDPAGHDLDPEAATAASRILLCGGDHAAALQLREQLKEVGFATDFAHTASDALVCAMATQYHTILLSRQLPDGDGTSLILRLRELPQYRDTSIIVVSPDPMPAADEIGSPKLNVLDWLSKPVDFDRLMRVLKKPVVKDEHGNPVVLNLDDVKDISPRPWPERN